MKQVSSKVQVFCLTFFLTWISQFLSPHFTKNQLEATKKANFLRLWNKQKRKHWTDVTKWRNGKKTKKNWTENKRRRLRKSSQEKFKSRRFIDVREPLLFSSVTWPLPTLFRVENVSHLIFFVRSSFSMKSNKEIWPKAGAEISWNLRSLPNWLWSVGLCSPIEE